MTREEMELLRALEALLLISIIEEFSDEGSTKTHGHTCSCGHHWEHGYDCINNEAAHTCQKCGTVQWRKDH